MRVDFGSGSLLAFLQVADAIPLRTNEVTVYSGFDASIEPAGTSRIYGQSIYFQSIFPETSTVSGKTRYWPIVGSRCIPTEKSTPARNQFPEELKKVPSDARHPGCLGQA
jgi:hypothetical protein